MRTGTLYREQKKNIQIRIYPSDKLEDTRYETVIDGRVSPKMTPNELADQIQTTALGTIIL